MEISGGKKPQWSDKDKSLAAARVKFYISFYVAAVNPGVLYESG